MSDAAAWEPPIVTVLRRHVARKVPQSVLLRLAGGPANWRMLDAAWNIVGRVEEPAPETHGPLSFIGVILDTEERRVALLRYAADCVDAGRVFPTSLQLGPRYGVSPPCISYDLKVLRAQGRLFIRVVCGTNGPRRVIEVAGKPGTTALPMRDDA